MPRVRFCLLLLLVFASGLTEAQTYAIERVEQDVYLLPDGSVRVLDTQTFSFDGDFRNRRYGIEVEPAPGGSVRFEGVEALDGRPVSSEVTGDEIVWRVDAQSETRTFRIGYTLTREVEVAEDAAQFDRFLLPPEHEPIGHYLLRVHPPAPSPEGFRVFIFTGQGRIGTLDFSEDFSLATVAVAPLSEDEFVRARVIVDAANFSVQTQEGEWLTAWLAEVEAETQGFREESQRRLEGERYLPPPPPSDNWLLLLWSGVAGLGLWLFWSYRVFGREPKIEDVGPYYREPAEEIPPAAVPFVMTQSDPGMKAASPAIAATLLDFARRGYLMMETVENPKFLGLGRAETVYYGITGEPQALTPFEAELWQAFKGAATSTGSASFGSILEALSARGGSREQKPNSNPEVFDADDLRRYFEARPNFARNWISQPRAWYETQHGKLLDPAASGRALVVAAACFAGAAVAAFSGFGLAESSERFFFHFIAAGVVLAVLGVVAASSLKRWQADKLLNARRWQAYRKFLSDFSLMREAPAEHYKLWDYHFVYATALGVSKEYLRNLQALMKLEPDKFSTPLWLAGGRGPAMNQMSTLNSLESLTRSLNTLSQVETNLRSLDAALSPQTKTGGGFGGGGMGGSGVGGGPRGGGGGRGMR